MAEQRHRPIPADQLQKCDIWAFGLCVWEILADGKVYFQRGWLDNSNYRRSLTHTASPATPTPKTHDDAGSSGDDQYGFGRFDVSHLKSMAIAFLQSMVIPGVGFEKGFLRPLLNGTLQVDPNQRISDLSRLPIIGFWNKLPGGNSLQSKLATYALSGEIRYSIFDREGELHIIWDQQRQLLQEFEAEAQRIKPSQTKGDTSAVFQTMLCYVNGFGTSRDLPKAAQFLRKSQETSHFLAEILGARILNGLDPRSPRAQMEYSQCLAAGFMALGKAEQSSSLVVHNGKREESTTRFDSYTALREAFVLEEAVVDMDKEELIMISITRASSPVRHSLLEIAAQHGDIELLDMLLPRLNRKWNYLVSSPGSLLAHAARCGHGTTVEYLLRESGYLERDEISSFLHWLFCLDPASLREVQTLLKERIGTGTLRVCLLLPTVTNTILHAQWPFQTQGAPLSTAIASGNIDAVKVLLALGAQPLASAYGITSIHRAVRYHLPEILQLIWRSAFDQTEIDSHKAHHHPALVDIPIACSLSLLTNAERFAMHGGNYMNNLRRLIELLPRDILTQSSSEGRTALTQAIDLEDVDVLDLILERYPELAREKLVDPEDEGLFTYPLHFAVQIGADRDTDESIRILETILRLHPSAIDCPDSAYFMPLHIAVMGASPRVTKWLLDLGTSPNQVDMRDQAALHFCRSSMIAEALLGKGAEVNHKDGLGFTPVFSAINHGAEAVLEVLIAAGADLSSKDNGIGTPLHCAVHRKSLSMTLMLLKADVGVDDIDLLGRTPLFVAMSTGLSDIVSLLLEHGADPFIEDKSASGCSAFRLALAWDDPSIFDLLRTNSKFDSLNWDSKIQTLHFAAEKGHPVSLRLYLCQMLGPSLDTVRCSPAQKESIATSIHIAASACRVDLVDVLLSHGFDVDYPDSRGNTPLLLACQAGQKDLSFNPYHRRSMCERLIKDGASIFTRNKDGLTPLASAAVDDFPVMTLLLDRALELGGWDVSLRRTRLFASIKDHELDAQYCQEAHALIDTSVLMPSVLSRAVVQGEWDFIMTYIGGLFTTRDELCRNPGFTGPNARHFLAVHDGVTYQRSSERKTRLKRLKPKNDQLSRFPEIPGETGSIAEESDNEYEETRILDSVSALRLFCVTKNREMVLYEYNNLHETSIFSRLYNFSSRNLESESSETKKILTEILWGRVSEEGEERSPLKERSRRKEMMAWLDRKRENLQG